MSDNEKLIERLRAVIETATSDSSIVDSQMSCTPEDYASGERDRTEAEAVRDAVIAALTPTDDEREALAKLVAETSIARGGPGYVTPSDIADAILAAGFRRSVVPEPSTEHRCEDCQTCGVHGNSHLKCCGCYDGACCQESVTEQGEAKNA